MVNSCCILYCHTKSGNGNTLKLFPKNQNLREKWIKSINRKDWEPSPTSVICQLHFLHDMFETIDGKKRLKAQAIPTIFPLPTIRKRLAGRTFVKPLKKQKIDVVVNNVNELVAKQTASKLSQEQNVTLDNTERETELEIENHNGSAFSASSTKLMNESSQEESVNDNCKNQTSENDVTANSFFSLTEKENTVFREKTKEEIEQLFLKQEKKIKDLKERLQNVINEKQEMERNGHTAYKNILMELFTEDQINYLLKYKNEDGKMKRQHWSNSTIKKALRLRFTCGNTGYDELLKQGLPLPSRRTLSKRVEHIKFEPGISEEMFKYLEYKVTNFTNDSDRQCSLALDEVSIMGGRMFDPQTKKFIGDITLPPSSQGIVKHALVFVLIGSKARWKQIIGYEYTGGGFDGKLMKPIILQIISKAENIGLRVNSVTCDMGPVNVACLNSFGITAGRKTEIKNSIPHPHPHDDNNRKLFFFADVPHLVKNIVQSIINNGVIYIPEDIQTMYNLPTNVIVADHLLELLEAQEDLIFTLTPNLKKEDIFLSSNNSFQKMKVKRAQHILSSEVSAALYYLSDENKKEEYQTTAWFVGLIAKWFRIMTSRNLQSAISKFNITTYNETISFLNEMITLMNRICIGDRGIFKPIQKGFMLSTKSAIELSQYLIDIVGFKFVLTGRFTQDAVENLFSVVRSKHVTPNVLQLKYDLRLISIAQYTKSIKSSNYDYDDSYFLSDFLEENKNNTSLKVKTNTTSLQQVNSTNSENLFPNVESNASRSINLNQISPSTPARQLNNIEKNALYRVAGYLINSIQKNSKTCDSCIASVGSRKSAEFAELEFAKFVAFKEYKENLLFYVNERTFNFFLEIDLIYRNWDPILKDMRNINVLEFFSCRYEAVDSGHILPCHSLRDKILRRFVVFCLRICNQAKKKEKNEMKYDSKSMAMHAAFR